MSKPKTGDKVITLDGKELGRVKEVGNTCFKVNAPRRRDFWLPGTAIERRVGNAAVLLFDKDHLNESEIDAESHSGLHVHGDETGGPLKLPAGLVLLAAAALVALVARSRRNSANSSRSAPPGTLVITTAAEEAEVRGAEAAAAEAKRQAEQQDATDNFNRR